MTAIRRLGLGLILAFGAVPVLSGCMSTQVQRNTSGTSLSSFTISKFTPGANDPTWSKVNVGLQRTDGDKAAINQSFTFAAFQSGNVQNWSLLIPQGTYTIALDYLDGNSNKIYHVCDAVAQQSYKINTPTFTTNINICKIGNATPTNVVAVTPTSNVQLNPTLQGGTVDPTGTSPATSPSTAPAGGTFPQVFTSSQSGTAAVSQVSLPALTLAANLQGSCINYPGFGLPQAPVQTATIQYPTAGSLTQLPPLAMGATPDVIKAWVATVYHTFPVFAQIYETQLGLTTQQALGFMYGDMSKESGQGTVWAMNYETGNPGPGDAWGVFQAAVTNYIGGYADSNGNVVVPEDFSGLPVPGIALFKDPATSTYAGMKRLADGVLNSMRTFGLNQTPEIYLLGALADHNTGYPSSATDVGFLTSYGLEVMRFMQGYQTGSNMTNATIFWTGMAGSVICQ